MIGKPSKAILNYVKGYDYTAFEVYPNAEQINAGDIDDVTGLTYKVSVPAQTVCKMEIQCYLQPGEDGIVSAFVLSDANQYVEWGDGETTYLSDMTAYYTDPGSTDQSNPSAPVYTLGKKTYDSEDQRVKVFFQHDYSTSITATKKRFICKVYGDVLVVRNNVTNHQLVSRCMEHDLPISRTVWHLASFATGNPRLLRIRNTNKRFTVKNLQKELASPVSNCKNLQEITGLNLEVPDMWMGKISELFAGCDNLKKLDATLPRNTKQFSSITNGDSELTSDIDNLIPEDGFTNLISCDGGSFYNSVLVKESELPRFHSHVFGKIPPMNMFQWTGLKTRRHVPIAYGGHEDRLVGSDGIISNVDEFGQHYVIDKDTVINDIKWNESGSKCIIYHGAKIFDPNELISKFEGFSTLTFNSVAEFNAVNSKNENEPDIVYFVINFVADTKNPGKFIAKKG